MRPRATWIRTWSRPSSRRNPPSSPTSVVANAVGLMQLLPSTGRPVRARLEAAASRPAAHRPGDEHPDGHGVLGGQDATSSATFTCARQLQRGEPRSAAGRPSGPGARARRVHRRHPVSRNAALREEDSRHGRGLPALYGGSGAEERGRDAGGAARSQAAAAEKASAGSAAKRPAAKKPPAKAPVKKKTATRAKKTASKEKDPRGHRHERGGTRSDLVRKP